MDDMYLITEGIHNFLSSQKKKSCLLNKAQERRHFYGTNDRKWAINNDTSSAKELWTAHGMASTFN